MSYKGKSNHERPDNPRISNLRKPLLPLGLEEQRCYLVSESLRYLLESGSGESSVGLVLAGEDLAPKYGMGGR